MYLDISRMAKIADSVDAMNLDIYGSNPENVASVDRPLKKRYNKLTGTESARVRHFVHVAMFRIPPFHVRNARAINVSS